MYADGYMIGDGSWELRIFVTDLKVERTLRVKGDLHVGGLMFKLVEDLGKSCTQKIRPHPFSSQPLLPQLPGLMLVACSITFLTFFPSDHATSYFPFAH